MSSKPRWSNDPEVDRPGTFFTETLVTRRKPTYCVFTRLVEQGSSVSGPRPYATLLAKGEDRQAADSGRRRASARAQWLAQHLAGPDREGSRRDPAGLLHHFESKEQLLNAVLDARDADDDITRGLPVGRSRDRISRVSERFDRAPELVGTFTVLLVENISARRPAARPAPSDIATRSTSSPNHQARSE